MHRPRQHVSERLVEQEARGLHGEEFDLEAMVLARAVATEAPAAVEYEADTDGYDEGDDHRLDRGHHIGRQAPVDRRVNPGQREADDGESHELCSRLVRKV